MSPNPAYSFSQALVDKAPPTDRDAFSASLVAASQSLERGGEIGNALEDAIKAYLSIILLKRAHDPDLGVHNTDEIMGILRSFKLLGSVTERMSDKLEQRVKTSVQQALLSN